MTQLKNIKPVEINDFDYTENYFEYHDKSYPVTDLIKASEGLEIFDLPIMAIDLEVCPWGGSIDIASFCYHMKRIDKASLDYPVIMTPKGYICDGWHRVAKAIMEGRTSVKAVRLKVMPEPYVSD